MDALLILGGLLLLIVGLLWLVVMAFQTSLLWGIGSLLPPLTLAFSLSHWRVARKAVFVCGLGCIPLVVGLSLLASRDVARFERIISLDWLQPDETTPSAERTIRLSGEFNGQPFAPQLGELIDGALVLREGLDVYASRTVTIRLPEPVDGPLRLSVLPEDAGDLPEVEIVWLNPGQTLPEARRLSRGYTLHLNLQPLPPNRLQGDFHLVLPAQYATTLTGTVELFTDRLRYRAGEVDRHHDSTDTLAHVIRDYLQRRERSRAVGLHPLAPVRFPAERLEIEAHVVIGKKERIETLVLHKRTQGWVVEGDRYPALPAIEQPVVKPVRPEPAPLQNQVLSRAISLESLLRAPDRYRQTTMRVRTDRGRVAEGMFLGLDDLGRIQIQRVLEGPGEAIYTLRTEQVVEIEALSR